MANKPQTAPARSPAPKPDRPSPPNPDPGDPPGIADSILPERKRDAARHPDDDADAPEAPDGS